MTLQVGPNSREDVGFGCEKCRANWKFGEIIKATNKSSERVQLVFGSLGIVRWNGPFPTAGAHGFR